MSAEANPYGGTLRRWREAAFALCTVWLVVQNVLLLSFVAWGHPVSALAAGAAIAKTAQAVATRVWMLAAAGVLALALAAYLVRAPDPGRETERAEVIHGR